MPILIGENGFFSNELRATVNTVAKDYPGASVELVDLTGREPSPPSVERMLEAVDRLYDRIETPYIFHCEDDWWLSAEDFISPSKAILEQFPEVKIVRLTGGEARPYPEGERRFTVCFGGESTAEFRYSRYGGSGGRFGAFTFNPGLRRRSDYLEYFAPYAHFAGEPYISSHGQALGHREAILENVFARHTGVGHTTLHRRGRRHETMPAVKPKVFGIGMFKTGTTSFGEAMQKLGYRSRFRFMPLLDNLTGYFDLDPRQFARFEGRIRREADQFDAFADAPWLYLYRQLSRWYPDSLFVLTTRIDAETVALSELDHWERHGLTERWMDEVGTPPTRQMFVERYERHNDEVVDFFRGKSHRILQACWEDEREPWKRLCEFVGAEAPGIPFPHANRSPNRS